LRAFNRLFEDLFRQFYWFISSNSATNKRKIYKKILYRNWKIVLFFKQVTWLLFLLVHPTNLSCCFFLPYVKSLRLYLNIFSIFIMMRCSLFTFKLSLFFLILLIDLSKLALPTHAPMQAWIRSKAKIFTRKLNFILDGFKRIKIVFSLIAICIYTNAKIFFKPLSFFTEHITF